MEDTKAEQKSFPVLMELPVQWGEMDAAGHVNNLIYLKWFESARVEYFTRLGQDVADNTSGEPGFILAKQSCKYLLPMTYPDTAVLAIRITEVNEDRFTMHCKIWSQRHNRLAAIANGVVVTYDYREGKKVLVPKSMKKQIEMLERMAPGYSG